MTFLGGADAGQGDAASNYNYFQYHVLYTDANGNPISAYVDRDNATNNTGFTFSTITDDGVTFTDRSSVQHTVLGDATLRITGERKDGSFPTGSITVTFGTVVPPPPPSDVEFAPTLSAFASGVITIDTATGGVDPAFLERVPRQVPATYRATFIWRGVNTKREVIYQGGLPVYKGQT